MDHNPDRLCVWPGYFDMKQSRRSGRRVPKDEECAEESTDRGRDLTRWLSDIDEDAHSG